jgi:DNA-binding beta-propeller fold protein YncE
MKKHLVVPLLLLAVTMQAQTPQQTNALKKLWETSPGLNIPESVLFDASTGIIYVSNVEGNPSAKDGNGFIATLSLDGKILKTGWVTGLDAPKGMGIFNKHLYVTNINEVVEIDIPTATIVKRYAVEGSEFLNDIAIDPKTGKVFISDSGNGHIYTLDNGRVAIWLQGPMYKGANGLFILKNFLYIGANNNILQADTKSGEVTVSVAHTGGVDGLYITSDHKFIFSDWKGSVFIASANQKPELLLNTSSQNINAADFGIIASKHMILIPTFGNNKVVCYTSDLIK